VCAAAHTRPGRRASDPVSGRRVTFQETRRTFARGKPPDDLVQGLPGDALARAAPAPAAGRYGFAALWLASVLVPLLAFAAAAWIAWGNVQADIRHRIGRNADLLREHALRVFEVQEAVLAAVSLRVRGMGWDEIAASGEVLALVRALDAGAPSNNFITLAAPDGRLAVHSRLAAPGWTGIDASDRDWFRRAREAGPGATVVSETAVGRVYQKPISR